LTLSPRSAKASSNEARRVVAAKCSAR